MPKSPPPEPELHRPDDDAWADVTWSDLEAWVGTRTLARARAYQREDRVSGLCVDGAGGLLARVRGGARYATHVQRTVRRGRKGRIEGICSCPMAEDCKHAAAAVAQYRAELEAGTAVPVAPDSAESVASKTNTKTYPMVGDLIARIRSVLGAHGRTDEWPAIVTAFRDRHRRKRRLQDEVETERDG
jgi:uncharacterized Zn finger protein